eukprot:1597191-Rhodomonas_salina.1
MLYNSVYSPLKVRGFSSFALAKLESRSSRSDPVLKVEYLGAFFCCRAFSSSLILISAASRALRVAMG